jgi:threonine/homoserine/homoserine lactone efflux protein
VLTVATRSAGLGLRHGLLTSLGIVVGDLIFIAIALGGLALMVRALGPFALVLKWGAAVYLMVLGWRLWHTASQPSTVPSPAATSLGSSFLAGLMMTLGDQKATLFYLGFFPAFLDVSQMTGWDVVMIAAIATSAVGGVKAGYALLAARLGRAIALPQQRRLNQLAAVVLGLAGVALFIP